MFLTFSSYTTNKKNGKYQHETESLLENKHFPLNYSANAVTYSPFIVVITAVLILTPSSVFPGDCSL